MRFGQAIGSRTAVPMAMPAKLFTEEEESERKLSGAAGGESAYEDLNYYTEVKRRGGAYVRLMKRPYEVKDVERYLQANGGELMEPDSNLLIAEKFQLQARQARVDEEGEGGVGFGEKSSVNLIFSCVRHNRFEDLKALVEEDVSIVDSVDDNTGNSLLHVAVTNNNKRIAKLLLKVGASIELRNKKGDTPLHIACRLKYLELAQFLIANGADDSLRNIDNVSPHMLMASADDTRS
jgi:hypothetical protein